MRKTICLLLFFALLAFAIPGTVSADGGVYTVEVGAEFVDAWRLACKNSGTVKLNRNVNIASEYNLESGYRITLDLNGYWIHGVGTSSDYIFHICSGASLTVTDSSANKNGSIGVTVSGEDYDEVVIIDAGGTLTLENGTLKGNEDEDCRLVYVDGGTFNLHGGAVDGNTYNGDGAGVMINEGILNMTGGAISNNHGDDMNDYGGGIYYDGGPDRAGLSISGGEIFGNFAYYGGAIYCDDGYAKITGGKIYGNRAEHFSAIYYEWTMDSLELSGDLIITGNTMETPTATNANLAAVGTETPSRSCPLLLGGRVKIYGNKYGNLFLPATFNLQIMSDIDTSPENHAWIELNNIAERKNDYVFSRIETGETDYSMCFFGDKEWYCPVEVFSFTEDGEPLKLATSIYDEGPDLTVMDLDNSLFRDAEGKRLRLHDDYTYAHDKELCRYTVYSDRFISDENAEGFIVGHADNDDMDYTVSLVKTVHENGEEGLVSTYYYLCKNEYKCEGTFFGPYNVLRSVYYSVEIHCPECPDLLSLELVKEAFSVTAAGKDADTGVVVVALYNDADASELLETKILPVKENEPLTGTFSKTGALAKAFWFESLETLKPLCRPVQTVISE